MIKQKNKFSFMVGIIVLFMAFSIGKSFSQTAATAFYKLLDASQLAIDQKIEHFFFMPDNRTLFGFSTNARMYYILNKSVTIQ